MAVMIVVFAIVLVINEIDTENMPSSDDSGAGDCVCGICDSYNKYVW